MRARTHTRAAFRPASRKIANGSRKWAAIKPQIAAFDPDLIARDDQGGGAGSAICDPRYNHWINVRNGLMNAHAELFAQIPAIAKTLPTRSTR